MGTTKAVPANVLVDLMAYEDGTMDPFEVPLFFQALIDTGLAWKLQGHYGRTAAALIEAGHCSPAGP